MSKSPHSSPSDIEQLIRDAGNYVRPSDDLRPQILEDARIGRRERRALDRIWQLVLVLMFFTVVVGSRKSIPPRELIPVHPVSGESWSDDRDNPGWEAVDAYNETRRRQAALFRVSL